MDFLTCKDVAEIFDVKLRTVYVWIQRTKNGKGFLPEPDFTLGNKPLWKKETIINSEKYQSINK